MYDTVNGLVLRSVRYKEAAKILTVLTDRYGKLTITDHGALGKSGKSGAADQILCYSEFTLQELKGRYTVKEARAKEQFLGLRQDIAALAMGCYFAEVLECVCGENLADAEALSLALNALYALSNGLFPAEQIKAVFELRLLSSEGYLPELNRCPICGRTAVGQPFFSPENGILHCRDCGASVPGNSLRLEPGALQAMRYVVSVPAKRAFSFRLEGAEAENFSLVCERFLLRQLDRNFESLNYWKNVK